MTIVEERYERKATIVPSQRSMMVGIVTDRPYGAI